MVAANPTARTALSHPAFTGLSTQALSDLIIELAPSWQAAVEGRRHARRGGPRRRAAKHSPFHLVYTDQVLVALAWLRHDLPHACLAVLFAVDTSTISRAIHLVVGLLARRGIKIPQRPARATTSTTPVDADPDADADADADPDADADADAVVAEGAPHYPRPSGRLHTLADVFAYAAAEDVDLCVDATEVQVRRPVKNKKGRHRFVSGKARQHTYKTVIVSDRLGRVLFAGHTIPGRRHDAFQAHLAGLVDLCRRHPRVRVYVDDGYVTAAKEPNVIGPPPKPGKDVAEPRAQAMRAARHAQSSKRIVVEHTISRLKKWAPLCRWRGIRERFPTVITAIAGLVSDRY